MESKPRMILVTGEELERIQAAGAGDLSVPNLVKQLGGYWADAGEMRAYRASQSTSTVKHD